MIRAVNDARAARGLPRLRLGSWLQYSAHHWARYLLTHDTFYHGSIGYRSTENIAWLTCRSGWARTTVRMWLNSPAHRAALLDRSARRLGIGATKGPWKAYSCVWMGVARFR